MQAGLYSPGEFKDNCGFGLIAHLQGDASHKLLTTAIESLTCMTHRGGIASDGKTGDGCGLLIQKPETFFRTIAKELWSTELAEKFAVGVVFLSQDKDLAQKERDAMNAAIAAQGMSVVGWRVVPVDHSVCGPIALDSVPQIEQVFIDAGEKAGTDLAFENALFVARRKAEIALTDGHEDFYVASLQMDVVSYKGLVMPVDLPAFYKDLADERLETAICIFHQRFSTNTLPRWPLAQPFRMLAHNGEINTIMGNRNWADARSNKFVTDALPELQDLKPLVNRTGSDSSSMDNMLEVLLTGGMDLYRAARMMVPPAWQNIDNMDADLKAFYEYNSMHMEPWDGPAGIVLTDGQKAVCMLDRNGLRPARYVVTKNGFIVCASEVGTYDYAPEDVIEKGRVGPGQMLSVDTKSGEILLTHDIEMLLPTIISRCRVVNIRPSIGQSLLQGMPELTQSETSQALKNNGFVNLTQLPELTDQAIHDAFEHFKVCYVNYLNGQAVEADLLQQILAHEHALRWLEQITVNLLREQFTCLDNALTNPLLTTERLNKVYKVIISGRKQIKCYTQTNKQFVCEQLVMAISQEMEKTKNNA